MNDADKILQAIETLTTKVDGLEAGQRAMQADITGLKDSLSHTNTAIKALPTKQDVEVAIDAAKSELKADIAATKGELKAEIYNLDAKVVKKIQRHERRFENIEEHTGIENPEKN
jgi:uncharacterized protein YhaN